jgi:hypothetical protein
VNRGAVAIVDALGFKGIWGNVERPSTRVLATLKTIGEAARADVEAAALYLDRKSLPDEVVKNLKDPFIKVVQLSDTVVIAAGRRERARGPWQRHTEEWQEKFGLSPDAMERGVDAYLRYVVCRCVCRLVKTALFCDTPLLYRGVVTVGHFEIDENFLLGPAVDEAAELMDLADGPFVWLAPTADRLKHVIREATNDRWREMAVSFAVPLKGGRRLPTHVLNPWSFCSSKDEQKRVRTITMRSLDSTKVDVLVKKGNAQELFDELDRLEKRKALLEKYRERTSAKK